VAYATVIILFLVSIRKTYLKFLEDRNYHLRHLLKILNDILIDIEKEKILKEMVDKKGIEGRVDMTDI
jgi:hypothetical protein